MIEVLITIQQEPSGLGVTIQSPPGEATHIEALCYRVIKVAIEQAFRETGGELTVKHSNPPHNPKPGRN